MDTIRVTSIGKGIGPALLPVLAFARGPEGTGKLSPLPSHSIPHLCFVVSAGCSGGRPGAELCDCDSSHTLGDASLREYRQQERDSLSQAVPGLCLWIPPSSTNVKSVFPSQTPCP